MRSANRARFWILLLAALGVVFSGYLTLPLLFSGSCPLEEGCHYILGFPACAMSFILFLGLLAGGIYLSRATSAQDKSWWRTRVIGVSGVGVILLAYVAVSEYVNPVCRGFPCNYSLFIPLCVYGLVVYAAILYLANGLKDE